MLYQCMHMYSCSEVSSVGLKEVKAFKLEVCSQNKLSTNSRISFSCLLKRNPLTIDDILTFACFYYVTKWIINIVRICSFIFAPWSSLINNNDALLIANKAGSVTLDLDKMAKFAIIHDRHTLVDLIRRLRLWIFARFRRLWPSHVFVTKQIK